MFVCFFVSYSFSVTWLIPALTDTEYAWLSVTLTVMFHQSELYHTRPHDCTSSVAVPEFHFNKQTSLFPLYSMTRGPVTLSPGGESLDLYTGQVRRKEIEALNRGNCVIKLREAWLTHTHNHYLLKRLYTFQAGWNFTLRWAVLRLHM